MASAVHSFLLVVLTVVASASATTINVVNNCGNSLNVVVRTGLGSIDSSDFSLGAGGSKTLNPSDGWSGNLGLGLNSLLAEFTINSNGQDFYDISAVDGFFLGVGMSLTGTGPSASCSADRSICPAANIQGNACVNPNRDDENTQYAQNVRASCPTVYSWSKDDRNTFAGPTGGTFNVRFCP